MGFWVKRCYPILSSYLVRDNEKRRECYVTDIMECPALSGYSTPHTRIEMVRLAWLNQGIYGKMTQIAQEYQISRTWLYQLIWAANLQLETLFGDQKPHAQESPILFEPFILLLRLEGKCSLPSLASILKYFHYQPNSVGYLSECFQHS